MATDGGGFFSRWSRRKAEVAAAAPATAPPTPAAALAPASVRPATLPTAPVATPTATGQAAAPGQAVGVPQGAQPSDAPPPPTMEDVSGLTPESDFKPFLGQSVTPEVKNAALRKLFADPHFNVMDGLDIYIDDYSKPDPLPAEWLKQMVSAQVMKLVEEEAPASTAASPAQTQAQTPEAAPHAQVPPSAEPSHLPPPAAHDHPDLQLQPDHATRRGGTEPGAG